IPGHRDDLRPLRRGRLLRDRRDRGRDLGAGRRRHRSGDRHLHRPARRRGRARGRRRGRLRARGPGLTRMSVPPAQAQVELAIGGMTCASCAARVEKKLNRMEGVTATVNYATERARITCADGVSVEDLIATVEKTGYTAERPAPPEPAPAAEAPPEEAPGET